MLEAPPPGVGFTTVTANEPGLAISEALIAAVNCELLTNVVERTEPFQFTVDPETKPVPFTLSVNAGPPGAAFNGTSGWFMNGTGFD